MIPGRRDVLIISIRLLGDRWHGEGDWPPSPFRVFQALVAGAYGGRWRVESDPAAIDRAFLWLEQLAPPLVLAPQKRGAAEIQYFWPNNDLDAVGNDPRRSSGILAEKRLKSIIIEGEEPFVFIWEFEGDAAFAHDLVELCYRLHTFGRGVDGAYATGSVIDAEAAAAYVTSYRGSVARPSGFTEPVADANYLPCPHAGSLQSLHARFKATRHRLSSGGVGRKTTIAFRQPPKPHMRLVAYDRPPRYLTFELRTLDDAAAFYPITLAKAALVAKGVRDLAVRRLESVCGPKILEKFILGRGTHGDDGAQRVRFAPLPSIGGEYADLLIRRVLLEIPPDCPVRLDDLRWALSAQHMGLADVGAVRLVEAGANRMPFFYGMVGRGHRRWQTVTPAVLPTMRERGRNGARARLENEGQAALDVVQALRHAGIGANATSIRVQREPFSARGLRTEAFDSDRFEPGRLYHVDVTFDRDVSGLISIGDGRWLGLGLLRWAGAARPDDDNLLQKNTSNDDGEDIEEESLSE